MWTWYLILHLASGPMVAGEYYSLGRCEAAVKLQTPFWVKEFSRVPRWTCERRNDFATERRRKRK